jgi:hypothetical protein
VPQHRDLEVLGRSVSSVFVLLDMRHCLTLHEPDRARIHTTISVGTFNWLHAGSSMVKEQGSVMLQLRNSVRGPVPESKGVLGMNDL